MQLRKLLSTFQYIILCYMTIKLLESLNLEWVKSVLFTVNRKHPLSCVTVRLTPQLRTRLDTAKPTGTNHSISLCSCLLRERLEWCKTSHTTNKKLVCQWRSQRSSTRSHRMTRERSRRSFKFDTRDKSYHLHPHITTCSPGLALCVLKILPKKSQIIRQSI